MSRSQVTARRATALLAAQSNVPLWRLRLQGALREARAHAAVAAAPRGGVPPRSTTLARLRALPRAYWAVVAANACAWSVYYAFEAMGPTTFEVGRRRRVTRRVLIVVWSEWGCCLLVLFVFCWARLVCHT